MKEEEGREGGEADTELETAGKATHDFVWLPLKIKFNKPHYVYIGVVPKTKANVADTTIYRIPINY